ncbi:MAG: putative permease [candidate division BRC1 bacterium ADurb.BinA364]|nr:MAG: putative permease [candidate division BRC1 bacterium ADurb.BinA364]
MDWKSEWKKLAAMGAVFLLFFWLPVDRERFSNAILEALQLSRWYAREHVILCLVPAFFIAGAIGVFVSQAAVMKYLGARAKKAVAYGVASVSGSILAVCSCTVLPLFAGIWRMGAGLGPACAFLYSGPAINVLAIILTARILGLELGIARAGGAIVFSVVIGLIMHFAFRKEEMEKAAIQAAIPEPEAARPLWQNAFFFAVMIGILVFANWGAPNDFLFELRDGRAFEAAVIQAPEEPSAAGAAYALKILADPGKGTEIVVAAQDIAAKTPAPGAWAAIWRQKWLVAAAFGIVLGAILILWFRIPWWKVALAAAPAAILALALPMEGLWVLLPFSAAIVGFSVITSTQEGEAAEWFAASWGFAKQIMPLLLFGVLIAGFLLGRPGREGLIPGKYVEMLVGATPDAFLAISGCGGGALESFVRAAWPLWTNLFASVFGAFMYFATLTEVPILQGLIGAGMGKGPALALLLAGPALSLPNMLVIRGIMGTKKTVVFCSLVIAMATISGIFFGAIWG